MQYKAIERATALPVPESRLGEKVCLAVMTRAGTRGQGNPPSSTPLACRVMTRRNISWPSAKMARTKSWTCRGRICGQPTRASLRSRAPKMSTSFWMRVGYFDAAIRSQPGATRSSSLDLKPEALRWSRPTTCCSRYRGQRTAGERLQDRSARAGGEIFRGDRFTP
jgi:hypothetical protein